MRYKQILAESCNHNLSMKDLFKKDSPPTEDIVGCCRCLPPKIKWQEPLTSEHLQRSLGELNFIWFSLTQMKTKKKKIMLELIFAMYYNKII